MSTDNASNDWGRTYVHCVKVGGRQVKPLQEMKDLLRTSTDSVFVLQKCMMSGSDCNMWAAMDLCFQNNAGVMMHAVGSHVSGDDAAQQEFSTVNHGGGGQIGCVSNPAKDSDCDHKARHDTLPLLHCIGGRDEAHEALCSQQILLILTAKKNQRNTRCWYSHGIGIVRQWCHAQSRISCNPW